MDKIKPVCGNCRFYVTESSIANQTNVGECHYNPPMDRSFPVVRHSEWCGHHKYANDAGEVDLTEGELHNMRSISNEHQEMRKKKKD